MRKCHNWKIKGEKRFYNLLKNLNLNFMKYIIFTTLNIFTILLFCLPIYAQNTENKISEQEKQEIEKFVDSFMQNYVQTFDLKKTAESFFIKNYRQEKFRSLFIESFDNSLTQDEKLQNYFTFLDFFNLVFFTKADENNYDLKTFASSVDTDSFDFDKFILSSKLKPLFQKYPKAKLLFYKNNFSQIKDIDDYRAVMRDYQNIMKESRESITTNQKNKYFKFLTELQKGFFKIDYSSECLKDDCEGLPEKTKMFWCKSFPFYLLVAKENGKWKIVEIQQPTD